MARGIVGGGPNWPNLPSAGTRKPDSKLVMQETGFEINKSKLKAYFWNKMSEPGMEFFCLVCKSDLENLIKKINPESCKIFIKKVERDYPKHHKLFPQITFTKDKIYSSSDLGVIAAFAEAYTRYK